MSRPDESRPFPGLKRVDLGEIPYPDAAEAMRSWVAACGLISFTLRRGRGRVLSACSGPPGNDGPEHGRPG